MVFENGCPYKAYESKICIDNFTWLISSSDKAFHLILENTSELVRSLESGDTFGKLSDVKDQLNIASYVYDSVPKPWPGKREDVARFYLYFGNALSRLGNLERAVNAYTKSIKVNTSEAPFAYWKRGSARIRLGEIQEGIADFDKATDLNPKSGNCYYMRACAKIQLKRYAESLPDLDRSFASGPAWDCAIHPATKAYAYLKSGEPEKALAELELATKIGVSWPALEGDAFRALGRDKEAEERYNRERAASDDDWCGDIWNYSQRSEILYLEPNPIIRLRFISAILAERGLKILRKEDVYSHGKNTMVALKKGLLTEEMIKDL
jgi:tetratricopeptide (TPR) repeat protein